MIHVTKKSTATEIRKTLGISDDLRDVVKKIIKKVLPKKMEEWEKEEK